MIRALVASPDPEVITRAQALLGEAGDVEVVASTDAAAEVTRALSADDAGLDVVVLHEDLGPLPVLDLARDLNHRFPQVGVVLLAREPSMELMRSAMSAGIRSVVPLPLALTDLHGAVVEANEWAQTVQARLHTAGEGAATRSLRGRVIALSGAKGGVGTTTVAVQLALEAKRRDPDQSVCLVDLDLQAGDVRAYLDLSHRRSITDLIEVASELTTSHLADAMFAHPSGVQVLLPPIHGEDAEDLDGATTARILGGVRARFDTVILDCGSVMSVASAVATELADDVLLLCAPDVVSLRGANRMLRMWERLSIRDTDVHVLVNRASRDREIQPSLAEKVVAAPVLDTVVPDRMQDVESATNTGDPSRLVGPIRTAIEDLATELMEKMSSPAPSRDGAGAGRERDLARRVTSDTGAISLEFLGVLLPVAAVLLSVWQFILAGYTVMLANHAAAEGARVLAVHGEDHDAIARAARSDLHGHWRREITVEVDGDTVQASIPVPILMPGVTSPWRIDTSAGAVREPSAMTATDVFDVTEGGPG